MWAPPYSTIFISCSSTPVPDTVPWSMRMLVAASASGAGVRASSPTSAAWGRQKTLAERSSRRTARAASSTTCTSGISPSSRRMLPVSAERGESWLPAIMTTGASGSPRRSRMKWRNPSMMALLDGRTVWKMSPATSTRSGRASTMAEMARPRASETSRSRWFTPPGASRW